MKPIQVIKRSKSYYIRLNGGWVYWAWNTDITGKRSKYHDYERDGHERPAISYLEAFKTQKEALDLARAIAKQFKLSANDVEKASE